MHHNVRPVLDRPQQDGSGHRVVYDQRHAMLVGDTGQRLDIADVSRRIADALAKDSARLVVNQFFYIFGPVRFRKAYRDALTGQQISEQCMSAFLRSSATSLAR